MERKEYLNRISFLLKILILLSSFGGVTLSLLYAERDGYSHWATRLMYFTGQSNIWIGISVLLLILTSTVRALSTDAWKKRLYVVRYIFTVSITITGLIYCTLLAPFAEKANFSPWTFSQVLTHAVVPVLSVTDFFLDSYKFNITREHVIFTAIPPAAYFVFAGILNILDVDFGRGDTYPYFFMNLKSPAGLFGFVKEPEPAIGTFYWSFFLLILVCGIALIYSSINNKIIRNKNGKSLV